MLIAGDIVRIKSLQAIYDEGRLTSPDIFPAYASLSMRRLYGSNKACAVTKIETTRHSSYPSGKLAYVDTPHGTYTFEINDLEKIDELSYHVEPKPFHTYKLTSDTRLKDLFNSVFANFDVYAGCDVNFYGIIDSHNRDIAQIIVDDVRERFSNFYIPTYLLAEDLGQIEGYVEGTIVYRCRRCNTTYFLTPDEALPPEDVEICPECRKREFITPYHRYTPPTKFYNTEEDENKNLYLGVELEVGRGGERDENAVQAMRIMNKDDMFVYCSHDSSINNGFEIITMPGTLEYHKSRSEDYQKMFDKLIKMGYRSHDDRSCGLHIHFSRAYYYDDGKEHINTVKLIYLIKKFWKEITLFSRKDLDAIEHYARPLDENENDFYHCWNRSENHDGHYYALNIVNANTIEFRIFRGTLNIKTYMLTLTMVYNMITMAKNHKLVELSAMKFEDFLDDDGKEYFKLRKAMKGFGMSEIAEGGEG